MHMYRWGVRIHCWIIVDKAVAAFSLFSGIFSYWTWKHYSETRLNTPLSSTTNLKPPPLALIPKPLNSFKFLFFFERQAKIFKFFCKETLHRCHRFSACFDVSDVALIRFAPSHVINRLHYTSKSQKKLNIKGPQWKYPPTGPTLRLEQPSQMDLDVCHQDRIPSTINFIPRVLA